MKPFLQRIKLLCVLLGGCFIAAQAQVNKAEYYFDTDPGFGSATNVAVTAGTDINFNFLPSVSSLNNGLHRLFVRTLDAAYKWSLSAQQLFYKEALLNNAAANMSKLEWFIDTDPGFGAANAISVSASTDVTQSFSVPVSSLGYGLHRFYVRGQDAAGLWSLVSQQLFFREAIITNPSINITKAEYFIDSDPGFGAATDIALTTGTDVTFSFNPSIAAVGNGLHRLFMRTQDANGLWSLASQQLFYKEALVSNPLVNVVQAEYFFDNDPGFGAATPVSFTPGQDVVINISGNTGSLSNGLHRLFVRTKDAAGLWSLTAQQLFFKEAFINDPLVNIVKAEYFFDNDPGFGTANALAFTPGQDVTIPFTGNTSALSNGLHRLFVRTLDANNKWSLSSQQLFYKEAAINNPLQNIVAAEYFFDADPGFGSATPVSVTAGQDIVIPFTASIGSLSSGLHRLFLRTKDAAGLWTMTAQQLLYKEAFVSNPLTNLVTLEYFWDTDPGFGKATTVTIPATTDASGYAFNVATPHSLSNGKHNLFVRVVDANNWSLTTVKVVDFTGIILPLTLLDFSARPNGDKVDLNWLTAHEVNTKTFDVQRSTDGATFTTLGSVTAKGTQGSLQTTYDFIDATPINGMNYYRLKQVDADGRFTYSPTIAIRFDKDAYGVQLYPNPASSYFSIVSKKQYVQIELTDMNGRRIQQWNGAAANQYRLNGVAKGSYLVRMTDAIGNAVTKPLLVQ